VRINSWMTCRKVEEGRRQFSVAGGVARKWIDRASRTRGTTIDGGEKGRRVVGS
jgi:hypothetical protein